MGFIADNFGDAAGYAANILGGLGVGSLDLTASLIDKGPTQWLNDAGSFVGGLTGDRQAAQAARDAAGIQADAATQGIEEQRRQFDAMQQLLAPFVQAGGSSINQQQALLGLLGPEAQAEATAQIQSSPQFSAMTQQGENALLQNASATGGLRGGNIQAALAQFRPQQLSQAIQQQIGNLSGLTQLGQASAAGQGAQGIGVGENIANLLGQGASARAGGTIAAGNQWRNTLGSIGDIAGSVIAAGKAGLF